MPLDRGNRPSSAGAQLETQSKLSILRDHGSPGASIPNQKTGMGYRQQSARMPPSSGTILRNMSPTEKSQRIPDWLEKEMLRQEPRRHSLALGDRAKLGMRRHNRGDHANNFCELKIENVVSYDNLKHLKLAFDEFAKAGIIKIDYPQFRSVVKKCSGLHAVKDAEIKQLFMKIDHTGDGKIEWHEFCSYMYLEYKEKEETERRGKVATLTLPATIMHLSRGEPVVEIQFTPDGTIITVREDGVVNYWSPKLQLKNNKNVFPERHISRAQKQATHFALMTEYDKLIIGTGAREIQIYEFSSLEPCCQISALETVPLNLDYCCTGPDKCLILYGDTQGCVNVIIMKSVSETLRLWKNSPRVENMPNISLDHAVQFTNITYLRWKVHQDWVSKVKYFPSIPAIISASNDKDSALVIGCLLPSVDIHQQMNDMSGEGKSKKMPSSPQLRAAGDQKVFAVCKGVMSFDFNKSENLLVTGGMDKLLRFWNPYMPERPTGILKGHSAPIMYVCIAPEDGHIFSVSRDNTVKIWNIQDQTCLFTAQPQESQIEGELSACLYSSAVKGLYIAADSLAFLSLQSKSQPKGRQIVSHSEPVLCCGYSEEFRQVVSCSVGSVVKIWDMDTGAQVFEYGGAHGQAAITCMAFDSNGRRLVTGGRDGCLKMWNFNNGECLKILRADGRSEICDCSYLKLHRSAFVISVGWGRKVDIYSDSKEDTHYNQRPKPSWQDDLSIGHKEDIHCIAHCAPHLLATGSYDGEIIVWNVVSGRIQCRFQTPQTLNPSTSPCVLKNASILSLAFLKTRAFVPEQSSSAWLISSASHGLLHFWSVLNGGKFITSFHASLSEHKIVKLVLTQDDSFLFTADDVGFISVYDVKEYAMQPEQTPPEKVNFWRAHVSRITGLKIIEDDKMLITSSVDCSVRLWNIHGQFIGTFGQAERWSIHNPASWKHPDVPYEVLVDPLSMPSHPVLEEKISMQDFLISEIDEKVNHEMENNKDSPSTHNAKD